MFVYYLVYNVRDIYFAYIFPHIKYGIELFGINSAKNSNTLQACQNRLLKILCKAGRYDSPTIIQDELGIFNIIQITHFHQSCFVYNQLKGHLPRVFDDYFKTNEQIMNRSHRRLHMLNVPYFRLDFGKKSILYTAANIWNTIPTEIQTCGTIASFKRNLKLAILEGSIACTMLH